MPSSVQHGRFVLADYVALGIEHILGGTDHLLFVLTSSPAPPDGATGSVC